MNAFFHILYYKNLMFWKISLKKDLHTNVKNIGSFLVFGSFAIGAYYFSNFITSYLLDTVRIGLFLFHRFIGMLLFVFFITINVGNIVVSFSTLYRSPEVNFLLTSPVSYQNIFIIKFLDNFFYSSGTLFMVGFSVLLGYGTHFGLPWHFYLLAMFGVIIPFMFLAACLAVIVLLLLMKLASTVNVKILIGAVIMFYVMQIYLYFTISSPIHLVQEVMKFYPNIDIYFSSLNPTATKFLPNFWVSEILYFYVTNDFVTVAAYTGVLLFSTVGLFFIALALGNSLFYETWITSLSLKSLSSKVLQVKSSFFNFGTKSIFRSQREVLLKKELWQFLREPSQWVHFVVMIGLLGVFLASVSSLSVKLESPELKAVVYLVVFIFNVFLINSIALRFGFPMISLEGHGYWSMRSAPIRMKKVYWTKFTILLVLLVVLSVLISWLSNIPYLYPKRIGVRPSGEFVYDVPHASVKALSYLFMLITPVVTVTLASLNFSLGAVYSDFSEKNPIRIASSQGATMTFLLSVFYMVLLLGVCYYPASILFTGEIKNLSPDWSVLRVVLFIITVPSLSIASVVHIMGIRSLRRDY